VKPYDIKDMKTLLPIALAFAGTLELMIAQEIGGVGLVLTGNGTNVTPQIKAVLPGSAAASAGIKSGWRLLAVNGTNTLGKSVYECAQMMRGEVGTSVSLVVSDPQGATTNTFALKRKALPAMEKPTEKPREKPPR
jgi:C-terminal processing protease CtpA/Prc